ncbi:MAG: hypothetical protein HY744_00745 [Deltaproteobacteria bacterium]|nr:hypothetical protein [Deltaproteobacteria bacterium]
MPATSCSAGACRGRGCREQSAPLGCLGLTAPARGGSGAFLGEAARAASLADAITARPGELSAIYFNPGALADLTQPVLTLGGHAGRLGLWFARQGEPEQDMGRTFGGFSLAIGTPLPGPAWLRAVRVGVAAHIPARGALRFVAPVRADEPSFALYGSRAERTALAGALSLRLFERIGVGAGVAVAPSLEMPTSVGYEPGWGESTDSSVLVDIERELRFSFAPLLGVRAQPVPQLSLGLAYRGEIVTRAYGPSDTRAAGLSAHDRIDFYDVQAPEQVACGVAVFPWRALGLSADLVLSRWSRFRTIHNAVPDPPPADVLEPRGGLELVPIASLALRAGYAFEPSPLGPQDGRDNLLDADRHVLAAGAGWDLRPLGWAPLRLDAFLRVHLLQEQQARKRLEALADEDPELPGKQIANQGYPGFSAGGRLWQVGLSVSFFFGSDGGRR